MKNTVKTNVKIKVNFNNWLIPAISILWILSALWQLNIVINKAFINFMRLPILGYDYNEVVINWEVIVDTVCFFVLAATAVLSWLRKKAGWSLLVISILSGIAGTFLYGLQKYCDLSAKIQCLASQGIDDEVYRGFISKLYIASFYSMFSIVFYCILLVLIFRKSMRDIYSVTTRSVILTTCIAAILITTRYVLSI